MSIIEIRAGGRFKLKQKIGSGSFGDIYLAQNVQTGEEFAVKIEDSKTKYPQLIYEAKIIHALQGISGIPNLMWCGQEGDFNLLIMELLGDDIESLLNLCDRNFNLKTVLMIADQLLTVLEHVHLKGFLHRDLKPENLLMGFGRNSHVVHIIDYGLSKRYRDPKTGKHIPYREGKCLTGTARYASINTHEGREQSRRDDMESLGYILVYLYKGSLPWQGLPANTKQSKYEMILQKKLEVTLDDLCSDMPVEFKRFLDYSRKLKFEDKPDYHFLKRMFKELFMRLGHEFDHVYDWILIPMRERYSVDNGKVTVDLEFSKTDEVINYNLENLNDYAIKEKPQQKNEKQNIADQQGNNGNAENVEKDFSNGDEKHPEQKKIASPEYLRTELKSAGNRSKSPTNYNSSVKAAPAAPKEKPLQKKDSKVPEKKQGKDCNIF